MQISKIGGSEGKRGAEGLFFLKIPKILEIS